MEKYLIYGSNFAQYLCQLGDTPEITMVDSRNMAIKTLANRILSDLKNVLKPDIFEKYMKSDADTLLEYLKGENEEETTFLSEASCGIRYSDTGYSKDRTYDDGIDYTLGVAKQVIDVDSSGNIAVSLSTETNIGLEEIVGAMKALYSELTAA
jgi:hypothetical protein